MQRPWGRNESNLLNRKKNQESQGGEDRALGRGYREKDCKIDNGKPVLTQETDVS